MQHYQSDYFEELASYLEEKYLKTIITPNLNKLIHTIEVIIFRQPSTLPLEIINYSIGFDEKSIECQRFEEVQKMYGSIYSFMLQLFSCQCIDICTLKMFVTPSFINRIIGLYESEYENERSHLKVLLHRLYARFVPRRMMIRKAIDDKLLEVIYLDANFNGTAELLNILSALISGFSVPLSTYNVLFFKNVLLPLLKINTAYFHESLLRNTMLYLGKDSSLAVPLIKALIQYWPFGNSANEVLFIMHLGEAIEICDFDKQGPLAIRVFKRIVKCLSGEHLQIVDQAMCLFEKDIVLQVLHNYKNLIYPFLVPVVDNLAQTHWHPQLKESFKSLSLIIEEVDTAAFEQAMNNSNAITQQINEQANNRKLLDQKWDYLNQKIMQLYPDYEEPDIPYSANKVVTNFNEMYYSIGQKRCSQNASYLD
ncbi:hypothetical protein FGO68_gene16958 [Halteria grandinella]|uniref:Uncharacterized protein n=1 Tax=Halteria grandinella TaxID=5974 RepID=A0A8J8NDE3_HALGN|nr:hypothetical protein FGO68_gene16958 [Halteria grandinella]